MDGISEIVIPIGSDDMGGIGAVEVLYCHVGILQCVVERYALTQQLLAVAVEGLASLLVDVGQDAFLVKDDLGGVLIHAQPTALRGAARIADAVLVEDLLHGAVLTVRTGCFIMFNAIQKMLTF